MTQQTVSWGSVYTSKDGVSELFFAPGATLTIERRSVPTTVEDFADMYQALWDQVPFTPNPMNRATNLIRKQTTIGELKGGAYKFGAQCSECIPYSSTLTLLEMCRERVPSTHTIAHVNLYPGVASGDKKSGGLNWHDDYDGNRFFDHGAGIYSFSFYADENATRLFEIRCKKTREVVGIEVGQGDLVVMKGENFQKYYDHRAFVTPTKRTSRRINITMRKPLDMVTA